MKIVCIIGYLQIHTHTGIHTGAHTRISANKQLKPFLV
jgi:hypothetical protein